MKTINNAGMEKASTDRVQVGKMVDQSHTPSPQEQAAARFTPDQELVMRLKSAIDDRGKYSYRLQDMTYGFAAGRQVSTPVARQMIEERFANHVGMPPHEYLEQRFALRREMGKENGKARERDNGGDRER